MVLAALACAIAAPLAALFWLCGGVSFVAAFAAMLVMTLMVLSIGGASLRVLGTSYASPCAAWVLGVFVISLALYALVLWLDLRVTLAAAMLGITAAALAWWQRLWRAPVDRGELVGIALCGAVTLL